MSIFQKIKAGLGYFAKATIRSMQEVGEYLGFTMVLAGISTAAAIAASFLALVTTTVFEFFVRGITAAWLNLNGIKLEDLHIKGFNPNDPNEFIKADNLLVKAGTVNILAAGATVLFGYKAYKAYYGSNDASQKHTPAVGKNLAPKPRY